MNVSSRQPEIIAKMRLDSHAISPVVGYNTYVWRDTGKTISVGGFTKSLGSLSSVPIVDAIVTYECPYNAKSYLLVVHNALYLLIWIKISHIRKTNRHKFFARSY